MGFEFWLINEKNSVSLLLPVTPSEYEIDYGNDIQTVAATAIGDVNIAGHRRLMNVSISSFFTVNGYEFANNKTLNSIDCMDYVRLIKRWVDNKNIIRCVISDGSFTKLNAQFYVEGIVYSENHESNGDISYKITLREYRPMKAKSYNQSSSTTTDSAQNNSRAQTIEKKNVKSYTVVSGDYLSKIARKFYGDASKWTKIYEANKQIIGKNPNLIRPGQVLTIP